MTATLASRPKSILVHSRHHGSSKPSPSGISAGHKRVVSPAEKPRLLKNLRNYYARRRPMMQPINRIIVSPERESKVRFVQKVSFHEIPNRRDYSKEDKKTIWTSRAELKRVMLRNHAEYMFEGKDWRNAPEEKDFARDEQGQPIHPAHVQKKQTPVIKKRKVLRTRRLPMAQPVSEESSDEERENKRPRTCSP